MRLKTKKSNYRKYLIFLLASTCATAQAENNNEIVGKKLSNVCQKIVHARENYYIITPNGTITNGILDIGDIFENRITLAIDEVHIDTQHRLVVNRKDVDEFISPDLNFTETKATCPETSEFKIVYKTSTRATEIGKQKSSLVLAIGRQGEDSRIEGKIELTANVISPKIELDNSITTLVAAKRFFQNAQTSFVLGIKNIGTGSLIIDAIKPSSSNGKWYAIDSKQCRAPSVRPQGRCNIIFTRLTAPHEAELADVFEIVSNYKLGHPDFAIRWSSVKTEIDFSEN